MRTRSTPAAALLADGLTLGRGLLAVALIPTVERGDWRLTALLLTAAWWTDFFDGRVARTTAGTRLGAWDERIDTGVGASIMIGLVAGDHVTAFWPIAGALLLALYLATSRLVFSQILQAMAYGTVLWLSFHGDRPGFALMATTIALIGMFDMRRLLDHNLPEFFSLLRIKRS
jgi:phosphatidylglycerophosphate synthase